MRWIFMNTMHEWHSFLEGWCEVICPVHPVIAYPEDVKKMIASEHWYYAAGRAFGVLTWVAIIIGGIKIIGG